MFPANPMDQRRAVFNRTKLCLNMSRMRPTRFKAKTICAEFLGGNREGGLGPAPLLPPPAHPGPSPAVPQPSKAPDRAPWPKLPTFGEGEWTGNDTVGYSGDKFPHWTSVLNAEERELVARAEGRTPGRLHWTHEQGEPVQSPRPSRPPSTRTSPGASSGRHDPCG